MGTRSRIGVMHGDKVKSVYCHWDGYLAHNGAILQEHFDSAKANNLVALGDLSTLRPEIGEAHAFSYHDLPKDEVEAFKATTANMCTFYGRDRGEPNSVPNIFPNVAEFVNEFGEEYNYLFINGTWFVNDHGATLGDNPVLDMVEQVIEDRESEDA